MSTSNDGATIATSSISGERAPANSPKRRKITATSQETAVASFEGWGSVSGNGDQNEQVDMKGIQDQVMLTNMDQYFDEPVWRLVLGKLGKKTDIENCSNASPFFGDLLQEKREMELVLPTVFGILSKRYSDEDNEDKSYKETNANGQIILWQLPARRMQPHQITGILKCRLVSKKWNVAIEKIHRNEDAGHYWMRLDFKKVGSEWGADVFNRESDVVKFLDHFEATHYSGGGGGRVSKKCPFLGQAVEMRFGGLSEERNQAYLNKLMEMLGKFGDKIFSFRFYWCFIGSDENGGFVHIYLKLKQLVELMPNLRVLRISYIASPNPSKEQLLGLEEEMLRNPFPELTNLEMISADGIPGVLCNHLVHRNRQITRLEIYEINFNGNCSVFSKELPKLSQLSLLEMHWIDILEAFEKYPATLNLTKFHFHFAYYSPVVPLSRLFNLIGSKLNSDCCTDLLLKIPRAVSGAQRLSILKDSQECRLKLEKIERCQVISYNWFCMDFLLESKNSLREIRLELLSDPGYESAEHEELKDKQVIKFLGIEDKMEQSNIGKEIPHLRKLKVDNYKRNISRYYTIQPSGVIKVEKEEGLE